MREPWHFRTFVASAAVWPGEADPSSYRPGFPSSFWPVKVNVDDWWDGEFSPFIGLSRRIMAPHWENSRSLISKNHLSVVSASCPTAFVCRSARVQRWGARRREEPIISDPYGFRRGREGGGGWDCEGASLRTSAHLGAVVHLINERYETVPFKCCFTPLSVFGRIRPVRPWVISGDESAARSEKKKNSGAAVCMHMAGPRELAKRINLAVSSDLATASSKLFSSLKVCNVL